MDSLLSNLRSRLPQIISLIRAVVECESPSDEPTAVDRFVEFLSDTLAAEGAIRTYPGGKYGKHFRCEFSLPGSRKSEQILGLGHTDTVWPTGTLKSMPFREAQGRLFGPGVLDMKGGIALFISATRALRELDLPVSRKVVLLLNSDEEVGSESSRPLTEKEARRSAVVLVLEPAAGLEGNLKTARKGVGDFTVRVTGRPAHAGLDFAAGASAIVELARQVEKIASFTRLERGITVNPGVISGGTRTNVVPEHAQVAVDFRIARMKDAAAIEKKFCSLRPLDKRCRIEVSGGLNRPPLERSPEVVKLFRLAQKLSRELGRELGESAVGGGSDGNLTAALGIPTLDGLGAVGEGAHALNESVLTGRLTDRAALIAKLILAL